MWRAKARKEYNWANSVWAESHCLNIRKYHQKSSFHNKEMAILSLQGNTIEKFEEIVFKTKISWSWNFKKYIFLLCWLFHDLKDIEKFFPPKSWWLAPICQNRGFDKLVYGRKNMEGKMEGKLVYGRKNITQSNFVSAFSFSN